MNGYVPLWIRGVISLCNELGGRITSEEIANIAATVGKYGLPCTLVGALKRNKNVLVEVLGVESGGRGNGKIKIYRVTRKPVVALPSRETTR